MNADTGFELSQKVVLDQRQQADGADEQPVACTLRPREFADRSQAWQQLLRGWMVGQECTPEGVRVDLLPVSGVAKAVSELAELEAMCCPWMSIRVEEGELVTAWISSSQPGGPESIRELFHTPPCQRDP